MTDKQRDMRDDNVTNLRRNLKLSYGTIAICVVGIIMMCLLLGYSYGTRDNICTTKACIQAANMIMENIDTTVDPCKNFYEFSCGSFLKNKIIPEKQPKLDVFDNLRDTLTYNVANLLDNEPTENDTEAIKKAKDLYWSCMDLEFRENQGESTVLKFLDDRLGGWPILYDGNFTNDLGDIEKLVAFQFLDVKPFFDIGVSSDPKKPDHSVLRVRQPNWLVHKEIYDTQEIVTAYKSYLFKLLNFLNSTSPNLNEEIDNIFELERKFGMIQTDQSLKRNSTYTNMTIEELASKLPDFDWKKFIVEGLYRKDFLKHEFALNTNETILVDNWGYLEKAIGIYKEYNETRRRDLDNFYIWKFLKTKVSYLPKKYKILELEYHKVFKGTTELPSSAYLCANAVINKMEFAVGRIYVNKHFDGDSKESAIDMIKNILNEFKVILGETDWMDEVSKEKALAKAKNIDTKIGYPEFIKNDTFLNKFYDDYHIERRNFFLNSINITSANIISSLKGLRSKKNIKTWFIGPAVVNAFYSPAANQICLPAGILQAPFYGSSSPKYLNYGGIGSVIGHEITHGFDDRGRLFDKDGVYFPDTESLWTNNTIKRYKEKVQCIIDQYSGYTVKQVNMKLNGIQSQGENIADNGGVKESFRAYKKWVARNGEEPKLPGLVYTPDQLFFINYGQVWCSKFRNEYLVTRIQNGHHSPGEFRIIGPTSNSYDFAKTFQCRRGQSNNPVKKCSVW